MELIKSANSISSTLQKQRSSGQEIGLVPTMGSLHEGHLELIRKCSGENHVTVVSIFVNPTQFNNQEDLAKYPRDLDGDLKLLREVRCDYVFAPDESEMYSSVPEVSISFGDLENVMEGKYRPGHFRGVGLVVSKLLNIVKPDRAYFGIKDLQQLMVIERLVSELKFGTKIVGVPTVRESSGLAMSSRNVRLTDEEKRTAAALYKAIELGREVLTAGGDWVSARSEITNFLKPFNEHLRLEYVELVATESAAVLEEVIAGQLAICAAAYVGGVRLIDNTIFKIR